MKLVVDASVAIKWFFHDPADEPDAALAMALLERIGAGDVEVIEPSHFVAEVGAVLARKTPLLAASHLQDLLEIDFLTVGGALVDARALELAVRFEHHLFDTLYHAVAIETPGARLVTADRRYLRKAGDAARVVALADSARWLG